jgi:alcohol dehydrogenase (cytochrome c)
MKRRLLISLLLLAIVASALAVAAFRLPDFRWRAMVVGRKLVGQVGDVGWLDMLYIVRPRSGFELKKLAMSGDPYSYLYRPYGSAEALMDGKELQSRPEDLLEGKELFARNCARCHGDNAVGGIGPKLVGRRLKHGEGDWAIYRTVMDGVDGTAMQGGLLPRQDVWRVIGYLRELKKQSARGGDAVTGGAARTINVTSADLLESPPALGKWLTYSGSYKAQRFSRDTQINGKNVSRLKVQWIHQLGPVDIPNESTPIVVGNSMFIGVPPSTFVAIDVPTGNELWQYTYPLPKRLRMIWLTTTRGVSVVGHYVYVTTPDAHVLALDAASGRVIWDKAMANYADGYSMTSPVLPVGDTIVAGVAGADYPTRGFISAYDAATGEIRWRFNTTAGPGEPGNETWAGDSWKLGGADAWGVGAYDPDLGLIYWGTGNPNPDLNASLRAGDNLYSNCELALDAKTGKLVWYFQFTPGDDHDWDATQTPALIDLRDGNTTQKLLAVANRNGFFYVLDRQNGHFLRAVPFVKQTWASGLTPTGRPIRAENSGPTRTGNLVYPSANGGTTWWPAAYSPDTQLYYTNARERGGLFFKTEPAPKREIGQQYLAGAWSFAEDEQFKDYVRAIDPVTATVRWEHKNLTPTGAPRGGLLATAGGLLFGSDASVLFALDAGTGALLWSFNTGAQIAAPPITYRDGDRQVIAVVAGSILLTFALPDPAEMAHEDAVQRLRNTSTSVVPGPIGTRNDPTNPRPRPAK